MRAPITGVTLFITALSVYSDVRDHALRNLPNRDLADA
jgi:hypothetical protein